MVTRDDLVAAMMDHKAEIKDLLIAVHDDSEPDDLTTEDHIQNIATIIADELGT